MIKFLLGVFFGAVLVIIALSLCVIAAESDEREQELYERWKDDKNKGA